MAFGAQAIVNEDTSGDTVLLQSEIQRLRDELATYRAEAALHKVELEPGLPSTAVHPGLP